MKGARLVSSSKVAPRNMASNCVGEEEEVMIIRVDPPVGRTSSAISFSEELDTSVLHPIHGCAGAGGRPCTQEKLDPLRLCVQNIGSFIGDLFDMLNTAVNGGYYLPSEQILAIINAALFWTREEHCHRLFQLLQHDLRLRPAVKLKLLKELLTTCLDATEDYTNPSPLSSFSAPVHSLTAVELTLHYVISALQKDLMQHCKEEEGEQGRKCLIERVISWSCLQHVMKVMFSLVDCQLTEPTHPLTQQMSRLVRELMTLLCLPLLPPSLDTKPQRLELVDKVAFSFSVSLGKVWSLTMRQQLLHQLPSVYLQQTVIDYHLETEFRLHTSAAHFHNTESFRNSAMSLSKLCCVHLCRVPYNHSGDLHSPAFFLFLLCTLLQSHLKFLLGFPMVCQPLSFACPSSQQSPQLSEELSACLVSVKPHIERLVDRLSEDERLLATITDQECWTFLQLLVKMTEPSSF